MWADVCDKCGDDPRHPPSPSHSWWLIQSPLFLHPPGQIKQVICDRNLVNWQFIISNFNSWCINICKLLVAIYLFKFCLCPLVTNHTHIEHHTGDTCNCNWQNCPTHSQRSLVRHYHNHSSIVVWIFVTIARFIISFWISYQLGMASENKIKCFSDSNLTI